MAKLPIEEIYESDGWQLLIPVGPAVHVHCKTGDYRLSQIHLSSKLTNAIVSERLAFGDDYSTLHSESPCR
jgi:hypothetical protein